MHAFIPGSGCPLLEELIDDTISPDVDVDQYLKNYQELIDDEPTENALKEMKQYFLKQDGKTVDNLKVIVVISISSLSVLNPLDRASRLYVCH